MFKTFWMSAALAEEPSQEVVEQVSDMLETAGNTATSFVNGLPMLLTRLIMAAVAIFIGAIVIRLGRRTIASIMRKRGERGIATLQQISTLKSLITSIFSYIMYFIIVTMVLSVFGVDITSLLAVAGVGGIAIGFGAQTLVQDVISGLFIWVEGSIAVGDIVSINGLDGTVESIAIRSTVIRNYNGNVYVIPNGDIRTLTNMSRNFKRAIVDVRCPYEEDPTRIEDILNDEMSKAAGEIPGLTETPEVMSILAFETDCFVARVAAQCPVGENWRIERELRTRIKTRFDREGIVMPHYVPPKVQR